MAARKNSSKKNSRTDKMAALHATFIDQVRTWRQPESWRAWLDLAAQFHQYSAHNVALIAAQNPEATLVAGYRAWQAKGRQVRKGERSIRILAGRQTVIDDDAQDKHREDEESGKKVMRFFPVSVFDIEQTDPIDGADAMADHPGLPEVVGTDDAGVIAKITAWLTGQGWTVERGPLPVHTYGITSPLDHRVIVRDDVDDAMAAKTMLHEATHALLHSEPDGGTMHRGRKEVEAESIAYLAAAILGLDTAAYSTGYVAGWAATSDDDLLITTASTVMNTARLLVDVVEG